MLIERRAFLALLGAVGATASGRAFAQRRAPVEPVIPDEAYYDGVAEDGGFQFRRTNMKEIAPRFRRQLVKYIHKEPPGSLVVDSRNHALYATALASGKRASSGSGAPRSAARRCGPIGRRPRKCWRAAPTCRDT
jgi:lipoprotein-anchoring transpeptidase ErfK/SrfK